MKAAVLDGYGGAESFSVREVAAPTVGPGQVLVRVRAGSVNPIDWKIRQGKLRWLLPARFPLVTGYDLAGEVEAVGPEVTRFAPGDAVYGMALGRHGGAYAELALARESALAAKPPSLSFEEAAVVPMAGLTALQALRDLGELAAGERLLVNGGSGGVGHFAVQLGAALGARVTAVASGRNQDFLRELGAETVFDYERQDFTREEGEYDVVFDVASTRDYRACDYVLAEDGGVYVATLPSPSRVFWAVLTGLGRPLGGRRRAGIVSVRPRAADLDLLAHLIAQGKLRPVVAEAFPLEELGRAQAAAERGVRGKVAVSVASIG
jgi:NADPH:quinone reductase-like Zn-dependent oxidoreductase